MERILIYGAGVIGSLYAVLFSNAGYDVTVYARNRRLKELQENGLLYQADCLPKEKRRRAGEDKVNRADVKIISTLESEDIYDFTLVAVRNEQIEAALRQLKDNHSPTIITMCNTLDDQRDWEKFCGKGRILPAFPGAGGGIADGILDAGLTPRLIQPTTFGEIGGIKTARLKTLAEMCSKSGVPYQIVQDMHAWQLCHVGLVAPLADAYTMSTDPSHAGNDRRIMRTTAKALKRNMQYFHNCGMLSPAKFRIFLICPEGLMSWILGFVFRSAFGDRFMYQHEMKAPGEMKALSMKLLEYMKSTSGESL